jgi:hypothetical protein
LTSGGTVSFSRRTELRGANLLYQIGENLFMIDITTLSVAQIVSPTGWFDEIMNVIDGLKIIWKKRQS